MSGDEAQSPPASPDAAAPAVLPPRLVAEIEEIVTHYPHRRAALIPALHRCQEELGGWLSPAVLEACAALFGLEPVEVFGVASFYPMFHLRPVGKHVVNVCHNIACHIRGAEEILRRAGEVTGARPGETSPDGQWTVKRVECQGACTNAPMIDLDGAYHEGVAAADLAGILAGGTPPSTAAGARHARARTREHATYLLDRIAAPDSHTLAAYRRAGGYSALEKVLRRGTSPAEVIALVKESGLRGRGGAGFPCGLKWSFMPDPAKDPRPHYLAVNADESEPGTCKDRVLMERDPHGLLEGILLACYAIQAPTAYIYVRGEYRRQYDAVQAAIDEARRAGLVGPRVLGTGFACEVWLHKGAGAYICGEETGLMESLEGKRGHPRPKPPFPAGAGLWGNPTTVNNVETIFNVPFIVARGPAWFRSMGTEKSTGNILVGVSGHVERPGVYELPLGTPARTILEDCAGGVWKGRRLGFWIPGGSSTGLLPPSTIDVRMDHDSLAAAGSMLGTASMIVFDDTACPVDAMEVIARFYDHETCGQCTQCREGTLWLHQIFRRIEHGAGRMEDIDLIADLAAGMAPAKTICALSDAAAIPARSIVRHFRADLEEHVRRGGCPHAREAGARLQPAEVHA
ncbi:MAG: NADH-quinone oxidoreductase subunit NuoF [Planctomycetota bacterium]